MISVSLLARRQLHGEHTLWYRGTIRNNLALKRPLTRLAIVRMRSYFSIEAYLSPVERRILTLRRDSAPAAVGSQIKIKMPAVRVITNAFVRRK